MYESHIIKLTKSGKKFWRTNKTTVRIVVIDMPIELNGGYWDGGSREEYFGLTLNGAIIPLTYPTTPREYGGGEAPSVMPDENMAVCRTGTFLGKPAGVTAYVTRLADWNKPEFGI